jgi:hypothetical protein
MNKNKALGSTFQLKVIHALNGPLIHNLTLHPFLWERRCPLSYSILATNASINSFIELKKGEPDFKSQMFGFNNMNPF